MLGRHIAIVIVMMHLSALGQVPSSTKADIDRRTEEILDRLTLRQKIELLGGEDSMYTHAEAAVGLPRMKMSDASVGVRVWGPSTAYPASIALAASWDKELAYDLGVSLGRDARARGVHILLGPGVNISRAPMGGRNFEYLGEDPFLAARLSVPWIEGVQDQGVVATVKHFAANNSEYDRRRLSSNVDERTLRELYLPAFEAAVKDAHVGAIMNSYNLINGIHATQNAWLDKQVAKTEWGFDGVIMSDWNASYDGVAEANAGLDLEMPSAKFMNQNALLPAISKGLVSEATINDKVRRIIRTEVRFGFLDRAQQDATIPLDDPHSQVVALRAAREGIVLLKNENSILPLQAKSTCMLAVIGPNAFPAVTGGGGSSYTTPFHSVSLRDGLSEYVAKTLPTGDCRGVVYDRGLPTEGDLFSETSFTSEGRSGLKQQIFANQNFQSKPVSETWQEHLSAQKLTVPYDKTSPNTSVRWTGDYLPSSTGKYLVVASIDRRGAYRLFIDGKSVLSRDADISAGTQWIEINATAGVPIHIVYECVPTNAALRAGLGIHALSNLVSENAKALAAKADAVIITVGFDHTTEGEGYDRSFSLPWGQDELISEMAHANRKSIVTLNAGGGVDMAPWISQVPALLHLWYPGQEGGRALADILFGKMSPEGKLPISIEKSWTDNPVHGNYYPTSGAGSTEPYVNYAENLFVGYRYYSGASVKPLFPFGFGLSYSSFSFSELRVTPSSIASGSSVTASFNVQNTGKIEATDVAELYISDPSARAKRPAEELKGFEKIELKPGESKHVEIQLDKRSFAYWSEIRHDWVIDAGKFIVSVGDSSESLPLHAELTLR